MKKCLTLSLGVLALASIVGLPLQAQQRKQGAKARTTKPAPIRQPKAGHYLLRGVAPASTNGQWVYLYANEQKVDSAKITAGKFYIERPVAGEALATTLVIPRNYTLPFIAEAGSIVADLEAQTGTGTPLNDELARISREEDETTNSFSERLKAVRADEKLSPQEKGQQSDAIMQEAYAKLGQMKQEILQAHPNDALGFHALRGLLSLGEVTLSSAEPYLAMAGEEVRKTKGITQLVDRLRRLDATKPGAMFSDFAGVDDDNRPVRLSDYVGKGHYVLVDFWASWCGPCRREIAHLKKVRDAYSDKGLIILGAVVWDKMPDHLQAMKDLAITWPQIFNETEPTELYGISGIPQVMLFDPSGKIVARDLRGAAIDTLLDSILKTTDGKL